MYVTRNLVGSVSVYHGYFTWSNLVWLGFAWPRGRDRGVCPLPRSLRRRLEKGGPRVRQWLAAQREQIAGEKEAGQPECVGDLVRTRLPLKRGVLA
jgi:hypothetical protein